MYEKYVLIKVRADYADEFDVEGYSIMTESEYSTFVGLCENYKKSFEIYFGTNEYLEFYSGKDFLNHCKFVEDITKAEKEILEKINIDQFRIFEKAKDHLNGHYD